jgi:hypothetical protein
MTKIELQSIAEKSFLNLQKAVLQPLRNYDDARKFGTIIQDEVNNLVPVLGTLRTDLSNYKKQFTWDNAQASQMQRDIDNLNIAINALKSVVAWLASATIHQTLQSFEALSYPRELTNTVLQKDYSMLVSWDFWMKQRTNNIPRISTPQDILKYYIPFLTSQISDQAFLAIFGYSNPGNTDDKLLLRQLEILEQTERAGLTRAERIEFEQAGFTRDNITSMMNTLQTMYTTETEPSYKELLMNYYNDLANDAQVKKHIEIV